MLSNCAKVLVMSLGLQNNFNIPSQTIKDRDGSEYLLRAATENDVSSTTSLIRKSFQYWVDNDVPVSPAKQTEEQTRKHLLDGGFVLENKDGEIVGTFTLEESSVEVANDIFRVSYSNPQDLVEYSQIESGIEIDEKGKFLVFKKLAIDPELGRKGLGQKLYGVAEKYARDSGYKGMMLETVIEAKWLYDWYVGLGFEVVGSHQYSGSQFETLLLVKRFE